MKTIKTIASVLLVSVILLSCKNENKKEDSLQVMESSETIETSSEEKSEDSSENEENTSNTTEETSENTEMNESTGFSYDASYAKNSELSNEVDATMQHLLATYPYLETEFANAAGYVVFPKITKAGLGIGGAGGKGLVFTNNSVIGLSKLMQATIGFQAGGQQYTQVLFFKDQEAVDNFTNGKFKFSTEASAVILEKGATTKTTYSEGVATVIDSEKGAMFEASLGTQKFKFEE